MKSDELLKTTLELRGVPVSRLLYEGRAECFITYQLVIGQDIAFADDEEGGTEYTYQIHVFAKRNYLAMIADMKADLKAAGFYGFEIEAELYEQDTGYFHIPIQIKFSEVH